MCGRQHNRFARALIVMLQFILAALILLSRTAADSLPQTSEDVRAVGDAPLLQRAVSDGVRHIILTDHIDAVNAQADPEGLETSKDNAIADVKPSTRSIVVRHASDQACIQTNNMWCLGIIRELPSLHILPRIPSTSHN